MSLYLGIAIGPLIGEAVLGDGDFALVWLVTAGIAGVAVVLSFLTPETAPLAVAGAQPRRRGPLIHPAGLFPGLIILTGMWGMAGFFAFLPGYAKSIGMTGVSLPLLVYALVVVGLRVVGARVPDRFGQVRVASVALAARRDRSRGDRRRCNDTGAARRNGHLRDGDRVHHARARLAGGLAGAARGTGRCRRDLGRLPGRRVRGGAGRPRGLAASMGASLTFLTSAAIAALGCAALVARRKSLPPSTPD